MATIADLDELALGLPGASRNVPADGLPAYAVDGKMFCCHRGPRRDAVDDAGELLDDVLVFRVPDREVKELLLADPRGVYFTTPHFNGYPAVLVRISRLHEIERAELDALVTDAWLSRAKRRVARAWLAEHGD